MPRLRILSDRQKGTVEAVETHFPGGAHILFPVAVDHSSPSFADRRRGEMGCQSPDLGAACCRKRGVFGFDLDLQRPDVRGSNSARVGHDRIVMGEEWVVL